MHEVYAPFCKGANCYNGMEWSWMCAFLGGELLTWWEFLNYFNTILENRRLEVPRMQDFLGRSQPKMMIATSSSMEII